MCLKYCVVIEAFLLNLCFSWHLQNYSLAFYNTTFSDNPVSGKWQCEIRVVNISIMFIRPTPLKFYVVEVLWLHEVLRGGVF